LGNSFPTNHYNPEDEDSSSKRPEAVTQKHSATNQKSWYLNVKTSLQLIKSFIAVLFAEVSAPVVQHDLNTSVFLFLSRLLHKRREV
jgi:hypothetical protein